MRHPLQHPISIDLFHNYRAETGTALNIKRSEEIVKRFTGVNLYPGWNKKAMGNPNQIPELIVALGTSWRL